VRFVDLLKSTVMLSAGAATMLAIVTVIGATSDHDDTLVLIATGWWVAGSLIGVFLGRRPQVTAVACGFAIIWSLAWRRQDSAVLAVEERDGVTFYVERTSPVRPMQLVRTPGLRREVPTLTSVNGTR
jgi:hypothetical protein